MNGYKKISFCTVCMNRLPHIEKTFIENIIGNSNYPFVEFVLLDYNSSDGLDEWAALHLQPFLESGIAKYYKTTEPSYYAQSHSRNMAFRLATGDIVCNVDADNFIGRDFSFYINEQLGSNDKKNMLTTEKTVSSEQDRNVYGRICLYREMFFQANGYDEQMTGYGFEDLDLIHRLKNMGVKETFIRDRQYLSGISHGQLLRTRETEFARTLKLVLIRYINHYCSQVVFLLEKNRYEGAVMVDTQTLRCMRDARDVDLAELCDPRYDLAFLHDQWSSGRYENAGPHYHLYPDDGGRMYALHEEDNQGQASFRSSGQMTFWPISDGNLIEDLVYAYPQIKNRVLMDMQLARRGTVNPGGFGKGQVYRNLKNETVILD